MKARGINDSRYVGMSIYNVVVLCLITAPVSLVISSQADASFAFVTAALVFCCFLSMALIFVPKVVEVIRNPDRPEDADDQDTDQAVSKEEEERYRKLQQENEQLQQLIASREQKLKLLNQRLLERNSATAASAPNGGIASSAAPVSSIPTIVTHMPPPPVPAAAKKCR